MDIKDPKLMMLLNIKTDGYKWRERRQDDWRTNYTLGRDKVTYNRLTQRQSVNVPLMKTIKKTVIENNADMPVILFEDLDNDKMREILKNEYWKKTLELNKGEIKDIIDKKQEFDFGRTFDQWQVIDGIIRWNNINTWDILAPRYCDPANIDSWRFLIHLHIFTPISVLENDPNLDTEAVSKLKQWFGTQMGLIKAQDNFNSLEEKNQTMSDMGVEDVDNPILGETYAEQTMYFKMEEKNGESQFMVYLEAEDQVILMEKPLVEVLDPKRRCGDYWKKHLPYNTWAGDIELLDVWSDGLADIVRTPNIVLNSWLSQLVENRTLRNLGMNYYDSTIEGFVPPSVTPMAWGWYGVPGKPNEVFQKVDIPDLKESLPEMEYLQGITEKATAATDTQQGAITPGSNTKYEVQAALAEAQKRVKGMSKYYTIVWKERGEKFDKLLEANYDKLDSITVYKEGKNSDTIYSREIDPKELVGGKGYRCQVWDQKDKDQQNQKAIVNLQNLKLNMPDNPVVDEVFKRKLTEYADISPEDTKRIMDFEEQKRQVMLANMGSPLQPAEEQPIMQQEQPMMIQ